MTTNASPSVGTGSDRRLLAGPIDHLPALLQKSYALRHQVYCRERKFLAAENYPDGLETDEFDRHSIHVGAVDAEGELAGTARVVRASDIGLPLFRHCTTFPHESQFHGANPRLVEVGRLAVSRAYTRQHQTTRAAVARRRDREDVFVTVLKALYQATKRIGATHWLAATEKPLQRMLARHGFPFRLIGPENDYFGLVAPYQLDLREFDDVILSRRFPELDGFMAGLDRELVPSRDGDGQQIAFAYSGSRPVPMSRASSERAERAR
jgi:N-acyl amino acid synthase of PEP-CTERM/exosortase system